VADPAYITRIATILQSGSVMGTRFTVYESHISFVLQFLSDFGLYGCGKIDLEQVLERCPEVMEEEEEEGDSYPKLSSGVKFSPSAYYRESRLPLEVDVIAPHIMNRHRLKARNWHHRLDNSTTEVQEPLVPSVSELWEDERNRRRALGLNPTPEIPKDISESSRSEGGEWVAEARWWDEIRRRIEGNKPYLDQPAVPIRTHDWERFVMTTFESVEALWENQYKTWRPHKKETSSEAPEQQDINQQYSWDDGPDIAHDDKEYKVQVDISMLSDQDIILLDEEEQGLNKEIILGPPEVDDEEDDHLEDGGDDLDFINEVVGTTTETEERYFGNMPALILSNVFPAWQIPSLMTIKHQLHRPVRPHTNWKGKWQTNLYGLLTKGLCYSPPPAIGWPETLDRSGSTTPTR